MICTYKNQNNGFLHSEIYGVYKEYESHTSAVCEGSGQFVLRTADNFQEDSREFDCTGIFNYYFKNYIFNLTTSKNLLGR